MGLFSAVLVVGVLDSRGEETRDPRSTMMVMLTILSVRKYVEMTVGKILLKYYDASDMIMVFMPCVLMSSLLLGSLQFCRSN
jgi:hypothetical protein